MTWLRSLLFVAIAAAGIVVLGLLALPLLLVARRAAGRLVPFYGGVIERLLRRLCGIEVAVEGLDRLGPRPMLVAAKHQSALETYVLANRLPGAAFVLKKEILAVPIAGWFIAAGRPIAVDRSAGAKALRGMLAQARQAVAEGRHVVIFPEGTRTRPGQDAPYHPGVAALYGELGLPVVPMALDTGHVWPRRSLLKHPGRATLRFLEPIPTGLPRRDFMALLRERIEAGCRALEAEHTGPEERGIRATPQK